MTQSAEGACRRLAGFAGAGYDKGRSPAWQVAWFAVQHLVFVKWWFPARFVGIHHKSSATAEWKAERDRRPET